MLFLKYLDDLEKDKDTTAELKGVDYKPIIAPEYKWSVWAAPKTPLGLIDHQQALTNPNQSLTQRHQSQKALKSHPVTESTNQS